MDWKTLLAYITGTVDQELLLRNEYLMTENRILRQQMPEWGLDGTPPSFRRPEAHALGNL